MSYIFSTFYTSKCRRTVNQIILKKINPKIFSLKFLKDKRGSLLKFYEKKNKKYKNFRVKESQISDSKKNAFRGFYIQKGNFAESKLILLLSGEAHWLCVNFQKRSKDFLKVYDFKLNNDKLLYIPRGFAHGMISTKNSKILIMADNIYNNKKSIGINYLDPKLKYQNKKLKKKIFSKTTIISNWHNSFPFIT